MTRIYSKCRKKSPSHAPPTQATATSTAAARAAAVARALGAGPMIDAVALAAGPAEETKDGDEEEEDKSARGSKAGPADSAGGGRFGNSGKWVPTLSGAR